MRVTPENVANAEALFKQLLDLTAKWHHDKMPRKSEKLRCVEIGEKLNELGGFHLMTTAYYHITDEQPAASFIRICWHGIGDWQM